MVLIFAILEIAIMFFIDSGLDSALHKAVRQVRVGTAKTNAWNLASFKTAVCSELSYSFSCSANLKVRATIITNMASVSKINPIVNGALNVTEDFDIGGSGDYVLASRRRLEMIAEVEAALREVDVLLCASSMDPACRIDQPAEVDRTYPRQARTPFNVTGHPALAMMAGLSAGGLPVSVQFVGRYFDEATVFAVARAWERAAGTDRKHPAII